MLGRKAVRKSKVVGWKGHCPPPPRYTVKNKELRQQSLVQSSEMC